MNTQLDHIVIGATTLDQGVAWCEATLGVTPGPGGEHVHMGTHNRLLRIGSPAFPSAYLEIIAIAPHLASPTAQPRWFDLDNPDLAASLATQGPQLLHWVAHTSDIAQACRAAHTQGVDLGVPQAVSRMTPRGLLEWSFSVSPTGERPMHGALPHLIQWANGSPVVHMPTAAVNLEDVALGASAAALPTLQACVRALALPAVRVSEQATPLCVRLSTPNGLVTLQAATTP